MISEGLDGDDAERVLTLVAALADAQDLDAFVDTTLRGLLNLVPSIDASYNEMNPLAQRARYEVWPHPGDLFAEALPAFRQFMHQNPLVTHMERTRDTRTMMWSDFVSIDHMRTTDLHRLLFSRLGVDSQMAVSLPAPAGVVVGFALNRGVEGFSERDRAVMNALRPHLCSSYRSVQLRSEVSALRAALVSSGWSAALVDANGEVLDITEGASDALASVDVDMSTGGGLPAALRHQFIPAIDAYVATQPAVLSAPVRLAEGANGVAGWYVPSPIPPHVVLIRAAVDIDTTRLAELGLTARQVDVALALLDGGTNAQLAVRLGMAEGTVRKHLEHIYGHVDVDNRTSAVAAIRQSL